MKKLWKYMRDYRREGILAPLFKLLEASLELLVPLVMAQIIDIGIANGDRGFILSRCGILAALAAVGLVCSITAQYFAAKASVGFAAKLRSTLFKHIQSLSYSKLDTQGTGTLIARITGDINQVQSGMNLALRLLLRSPFACAACYGADNRYRHSQRGPRFYTFALRNTCCAGGGRSGVLHNGAVFCG